MDSSDASKLEQGEVYFVAVSMVPNPELEKETYELYYSILAVIIIVQCHSN